MTHREALTAARKELADAMANYERAVDAREAAYPEPAGDASNEELDIHYAKMDADTVYGPAVAEATARIREAQSVAFDVNANYLAAHHPGADVALRENKDRFLGDVLKAFKGLDLDSVAI